MINFLKPVDNKIIVLGQSCSGKTTFAKLLENHYYCFDALFPWHIIETFNLSIIKALEDINLQCKENCYVLDGWHTADLNCDLTPKDSNLYVVYTEYNNIVKNFPREINHKELIYMFKKWYSFDKTNARYFYNNGDFFETTIDQYKEFISYELKQNQ